MAKLPPYDKEDTKRRMKGAVATLKTEFAGLRTGRANPAILDPVTIDAYGQPMHLNQVGSVSAPEPRLLNVQVWDRSLVKAVDKAIREAGLGLNPQVDGQLLRIPIPELNEDRRRELVKLAAKYAEAARVAIRNVRRDGMDHLKKLEKEHVISEDQQRKQSEELQKMTDENVHEIDQMLATKDQEIMHV